MVWSCLSFSLLYTQSRVSVFTLDTISQFAFPVPHTPLSSRLRCPSDRRRGRFKFALNWATTKATGRSTVFTTCHVGYAVDVYLHQSCLPSWRFCVLFDGQLPAASPFRSSSKPPNPVPSLLPADSTHLLPASPPSLYLRAFNQQSKTGAPFATVPS